MNDEKRRKNEKKRKLKDNIAKKNHIVFLNHLIHNLQYRLYVSSASITLCKNIFI